MIDEGIFVGADQLPREFTGAEFEEYLLVVESINGRQSSPSHGPLCDYPTETCSCKEGG